MLPHLPVRKSVVTGEDFEDFNKKIHCKKMYIRWLRSMYNKNKADLFEIIPKNFYLLMLNVFLLGGDCILLSQEKDKPILPKVNKLFFNELVGLYKIKEVVDRMNYGYTYKVWYPIYNKNNISQSVAVVQKIREHQCGDIGYVKIFDKNNLQTILTDSCSGIYGKEQKKPGKIPREYPYGRFPSYVITNLKNGIKESIHLGSGINGKCDLGKYEKYCKDMCDLKYPKSYEIHISKDGERILICPFIYYDIPKKTFFYTGLKFAPNKKFFENMLYNAYRVVGFLNNDTILIYNEELHLKNNKILLFKYKFGTPKPILHRILYFVGKIEKLKLSNDGKYLAISESNDIKVRDHCWVCFDNKKIRKTKEDIKKIETIWLVNLNNKKRIAVTLHPEIIFNYYEFIKNVHLDDYPKFYNKICKRCIGICDWFDEIPPCCATYSWLESLWVEEIDKILFSPDNKHLLISATKYRLKGIFDIKGYKPVEIEKRNILVRINKYIMYLNNKAKFAPYKLELDTPRYYQGPINCRITDLTYAIRENFQSIGLQRLKFLLDSNFQPLFWYSNKKIAFRYKNKFIMLFDLKSLIDTSK